MQSKRLSQLPPYLFVEIDRRKAEYAASGRTVLDLGIGDPDLGAPEELLVRLVSALEDPSCHRYPPDRGSPALIEAVKTWASRQYGVAPESGEILVTIGSKEAIAHLPLAVADPGDLVLVPDPGYPVYNSSAIFAGAEPHRVPLRESNGFLPDLEEIGEPVLRASRLLYLNYPNNPTSAVAGEADFGLAVGKCIEHDIILVNDAAYGEIVYEGGKQALFPVARGSGVKYIEFFSFSKTFSITGWRVGFAIGSPEVISALARLKANIDSGVFGAIQTAVASLMTEDFDGVTGRMISVYRKRRDILAASLEKGGFEFATPRATFYFWIPVPGGLDSIAFCGRLLEKTGIVATPGVGFGSGGEGYFRLSLTASDDTIRQAGSILEKQRGLS